MQGGTWISGNGRARCASKRPVSLGTRGRGPERHRRREVEADRCASKWPVSLGSFPPSLVYSLSLHVSLSPSSLHLAVSLSVSLCRWFSLLLSLHLLRKRERERETLWERVRTLRLETARLSRYHHFLHVDEKREEVRTRDTDRQTAIDLEKERKERRGLGKRELEREAPRNGPSRSVPSLLARFV